MQQYKYAALDLFSVGFKQKARLSKGKLNIYLKAHSSIHAVAFVYSKGSQQSFEVSLIQLANHASIFNCFKQNCLDITYNVVTLIRSLQEKRVF